MSWDSNIIVFDLETGGLITKEGIPPITEVAMVCLNYEDLSDGFQYSSLIKPYVSEDKYTKRALEVSNITVDMLHKEGKPAEEVIKELITYIKKVSKKKKSILCGHNCDEFDIPIIAKFFEDFGEDFSKYVETSFSIDTMWWARFAIVDSANYKLGTCLEKKNIDITQAHRALNDTIATKELVKGFLSGLRQENIKSIESNSFRKNFKFQY